jgi:hypothetical protein
VEECKELSAVVRVMGIFPKMDIQGFIIKNSRKITKIYKTIQMAYIIRH